MTLDAFWQQIDTQLTRCRTAASADEVIAILGGKEAASVGDAFFAGSGGDGSIAEALRTAGWSVVWMHADYHWKMAAPDGSSLVYVEGDIYR
jgi:hypothetical protein